MHLANSVTWLEFYMVNVAFSNHFSYFSEFYDTYRIVEAEVLSVTDDAASTTSVTDATTEQE